jgi:3-dehydroquinate synthase
MTLRTVTVPLAERAYPIVIGSGLLTAGAASIVPTLTKHTRGKIVVVSNHTIAPLYANALVDALRAAGATVHTVKLPDGEAYKDWQTLNRIFDVMLEHACDRETLLVALGGGVVGDMVGFAAATYQRGIAFVQIPTTLLAQVDSSVGGKTAVNHPRGKNMIGAFHQPRAVVIDTDTLRTLPDRELRAGLAEVIKYGAALDAAFFDWLEANIDQLLARDPAALVHAIARSCEIKAAVVADDEFERRKDGGRAILNFGHTFGHAIEIAMGYGTWLHGEAVSCGMCLAAAFSASQGRISDALAARIVSLIARAGLPTDMPEISTAEMLTHMSRDKKNSGGTIKLILLDDLGRASLVGDTHADAIAAFLDQQPRTQTPLA